MSQSKTEVVDLIIAELAASKTTFSGQYSKDLTYEYVTSNDCYVDISKLAKEALESNLSVSILYYHELRMALEGLATSSYFRAARSRKKLSKARRLREVYESADEAGKILLQRELDVYKNDPELLYQDSALLKNDEMTAELWASTVNGRAKVSDFQTARDLADSVED